jgi:hypothetical protein
VCAGGDQASDVRHVGHDERADGVGNRAYAGEVEVARVRAGADDDQLRLVLVREAVQFVIVEALVVLAHAVGDDREVLAGEIERVAVRQVPAVREIHAQDGVARFQHGDVHGHVGLRARVRLHVGVLGAEQGLRALDRQRLGDVHELAAAVVPLPGVALGVLVGQHRARGREHSRAHEILRSNQFQAVLLPVLLLLNGAGDFGVGRGERTHQHRRILTCRAHGGQAGGCSSAEFLSTRRW